MKIKLLLVAVMLTGGFYASANEVNSIDEAFVQGSIEEEMNAQAIYDEELEDSNLENGTIVGWPRIKIQGSPFTIKLARFDKYKIASCSCSGGRSSCIKVRGRNHKGYESNRICMGKTLIQADCFTYKRVPPGRQYIYRCSPR